MTMSRHVTPVPDGYHTATPALIVKDATKAIAFYEKAFGAQLTVRMDGPDGKVLHAEIKIGDSIVFIGEESAQMGSKSPQTVGAATGGLWLYVPDADTTFQRTVAAGASVMNPLTDMFWGDRFGSVRDPFGHEWSIATHQEDVPPADLRKRQQAFFAQMASRPKP
jgi:PhnB protein